MQDRRNYPSQGVELNLDIIVGPSPSNSRGAMRSNYVGKMAVVTLATIHPVRWNATLRPVVMTSNCL